MKNKILFALIFGLMMMFSQKVFASELCSKDGYTILTINGVFTDEKGARENRDNLKKYFAEVYNNQLLTVDYLYNPTHLAGIGDLIDAVAEGAFDQKSDYDLTNMLNDASDKIKTEKVLLVAHSQGNFYANNFYDKTVSQVGGIPSESIGVYSVATPANRVAGNGLYITSDTDSVISSLVSRLIKILPANIHIVDLQKTDSNGHSFSDVYLKYKADKIVSDIKISLDKLKTNQIQNINSLCISPQKLSLIHKAEGVFLAVADPTALFVKENGVNSVSDVGIYFAKEFKNAILVIGTNVNNLLASAIGATGRANILATAPIDVFGADDTLTGDNGNTEKEKETVPEILPNADVPNEEKNTTTEILEPEILIIPEVKPHNGGGGGNGEPSIQIEPDTSTDTTAETNTDTEKEVVLPVIDPIVPPVADPIPPVDEHANDLIIDKDTTLIAGEYNYDDLHITNNAKLLLESNPDSTDTFKGVKITAKNIIVDAGSSISADGKGYTDGPGVSGLYVGATYGGAGDGNTTVPLYGKATEPTELGSGGFNYWRGGGAIRLVVSETFSNNGVISANGDTTSSGGSIYVTAKNISGSGVFSANGGGLYAGGIFFGSGGGGRIAFYYENLSFTGKTEATGGCGSYNGYSNVCAGNGTVGFFDTLNNNLLINSSWLFQKNDSPFNFNKIVFTDGAIINSEKETDITAKEIIIDKGSKWTTEESQTIHIPLFSIKGGSTVILSGNENIITDTLTITGSSSISVIPEQILSLNISNLTIDAGSSILADGKGYKDGPGAPSYGYGASYGGIGGKNTPESVYGNELEPIDFGSGGANNLRGGGAIRLVVNDTLLNNGVISANGDVNSSGGSIYITADKVLGSGYFWANGGGPYEQGIYFFPGGGGRIAIHYKTYSFTGQVLADISGPIGFANVGTVKIIDSTIPVIVPIPDPIIDPILDPIPDPIPDPIIPDPTPIPDPIVPDNSDPTITSYTFNGVQNNITINPLINNLNIILNANKNVNWMSIKIENESDPKIYKIFQSGTGCVDGTKICSKKWNGLLSSGELLQSKNYNGNYKIKVHIKDMVTAKEYESYLPSVIIVNIQ